MPRKINPCGKTRSIENPYEIWATPNLVWRWLVLKKYQLPENEENNPYARWFCGVATDMTYDSPELGDVYRNEIVHNGFRMLGWGEKNPICFDCGNELKGFDEPFLHNKTKHTVESDYLCTRCGKKLVDVEPTKETLIQLGIKL